MNSSRPGEPARPEELIKYIETLSVDERDPLEVTRILQQLETALDQVLSALAGKADVITIDRRTLCCDIAQAFGLVA